MSYNIGMTTITQAINKKLYSYKPSEFMPVFRDGDLVNKHEFVIYKTKRALRALSWR